MTPKGSLMLFTHSFLMNLSILLSCQVFFFFFGSGLLFLGDKNNRYNENINVFDRRDKDMGTKIILFLK